jgi:DsbC/DsbD-like thiol-disulfide interchange protein
MRFLILLFAVFSISIAECLHAQQKVESEAAVVRFILQGHDSLKVGDKTMLQVEVTPKKGWHVYSALPSEDGAYQPAAIEWGFTSWGFEATPELKEEGKMTSEFDEIMNGIIRYYKDRVMFSLGIKITEADIRLEGYFDFMACNDEKCIPLSAELRLEAKAKK